MRKLILTWVITRIFMVLLTSIRQLPRFIWFASASDVSSYQHWATVILHTGAFPTSDVTWQYPPGAGMLLILPLLPGVGYWWCWFALVLAADATALALLVRAGRGSERPLAAAWVWTLGVALLGRICYGRFDLIVSVLAVAALLYAVRRPALAGAAVAVGALLKVWPLALLLGIRRWRSLTKSAGSAIVVAGAAAVVLALTMPGAWSFLRFQSERGVQIESVVATPLMLCHAFAHGWTITHRYGAEELTGPGTAVMAALCVAATVVAGAVLLLWWLRYRWTPAIVADAALFAILLAMVTSRVLSPQYFVWPLGIAAVCVLSRNTSQRPIVTAVLVLAAVTQIEYPFMYALVAEGSWAGALLLLVRNGILVGTTVWSGLRLWRASRTDSKSVRTKSAPATLDTTTDTAAVELSGV
jgi:hypothetical protein